MDPVISTKIINILTNYGNELSITWDPLKFIMGNPRFVSRITRIQGTGKYINGDGDKNINLAPEFRFIVKELPEKKNNNCIIAFQNEHYAYATVLPAMEKYCKRLISRPEVVYVSDTLMIFRDLMFTGWNHYFNQTGFDMDAVKLILKDIANFHSASLIMEHKNKAEFDELCHGIKEVLFIDSETSSSLVLSQERAIDAAIRLIQKEHTTDSNKTLNLLESIQGKTFDIQKALITRQTNVPIKVITHGDLWNNNLLKHDKTNEIKFLDFQAMRYTSVAADLSYFLYVNVDPNERVANMSTYLEFYLHELRESCNGRCPMEGITLEVLQKEMDKFKVFGLISGAWVLPAFYQDLDNSDTNGNSLPTDDFVKNMETMKKDRLVRLVKSCTDET